MKEQWYLNREGKAFWSPTKKKPFLRIKYSSGTYFCLYSDGFRNPFPHLDAIAKKEGWKIVDKETALKALVLATLEE